MSSHRYSVCLLQCELFEELKSIRSREELRQFLSSHTAGILYISMNDQFRGLDEAFDFAKTVYVKDKSRNVVAIYDRQQNIWLDFWYL